MTIIEFNELIGSAKRLHPKWFELDNNRPAH
jgi:hypothetical protein